MNSDEGYSFEKFIKMCNVYSDDTSETRAGLDKPSKGLQENMMKYVKGRNIKDKNDEAFCQSLEARGYNINSDKYIFLQKGEEGTTLVANICPFPQKESDNVELSQKWHVLISWLAYLDTASNVEGIKMDDKYKLGKIERIIVDKQNDLDYVLVRYRKNGNINKKVYRSKKMNKWIRSMIEYSENNRNVLLIDKSNLRGKYNNK